MIFPNDDNGEVLRRMFEGGDSLQQAREIEFAHSFRDGLTAEAFAAHVVGLGLDVNIEDVEDRPETPWDVIVTVAMMPDHTAINELEQRFAYLAEELGGQADGWGCLRVADRVMID